METTMSIRGKVVGEIRDGIFKVQTEFGEAIVWFDEELHIDVKLGMEFSIDDGPITFWQGCVVSNITKGVMFWLDGLRYEIHDPEQEIRSKTSR